MSCSTEFFPTLSKYTCPLLAAGCPSVCRITGRMSSVRESTPAPMRRCRERLATPCTAAAHDAVCANGGSCAESCAFVSARSDSHACRICTGTGPTPATSAAGLGPRLPHLHRDWALPTLPSIHDRMRTLAIISARTGGREVGSSGARTAWHGQAQRKCCGAPRSAARAT